MNILSYRQPHIDRSQFADVILKSDLYHNRPSIFQDYLENNIPRLYRLFANMQACELDFEGPTLDVGSGWGVFFPVLQKYFPGMLPYRTAELFCFPITIDGVDIPCVRYQCEKDRLPYRDRSLGAICFYDVLEHLLVDPVFAILEFNRVLKDGGHLLLSTPNAIAVYRAVRIFLGISPTTENELRPNSIYGRHNREWNPEEVNQLLKICGFDDLILTTNHKEIDENQKQLIGYARQKEFLKQPLEHLGPEIFCVARKKVHLSPESDLPLDMRWPQWLYTRSEIYRKRPRIFPINVENPEKAIMAGQPGFWQKQFGKLKWLFKKT